MVTHQILFNSYDLTNIIEQHQDQNNTRISIQTVPKRHGGLITDLPVLDIRKITMRGVVYATDNASCRDIIRNIEAALGYTKSKLYLFTDRYYNAYKSGWSWSYVPNTNLQVATITMEFTCDDPFEYLDTPPPLVDEVITSGDIVADITHGYYTKHFNIVNPGNVYVPMVITVSADQGVAVTLALAANDTIGKSWLYQAAFGGLSGIINAAQSLIVDTGFFTVKNNGISDLVNWQGTFIWLAPGVNAMTITGNKATYTFSFPGRFM